MSQDPSVQNPIVSISGTGQPLSGSNYVNAFTPGQPNLLVGDAGISQIVDPLSAGTTPIAGVPQVPVVTDIVQVQKTSPLVLGAIAVMAYFVFFKKGF